MLIGALSVCATASAAELTSGNCGSGVKYSFDNKTGTLTVSGKGKMTDYRKRSLSLFSGRREIKSVVIKKGVLSLGDNTFYDCTNITEVSLPSGLKNIGKYAFWNCNSLMNIKIPKSVKHIGYNAFSYTKYYNTDEKWDYGVLYIGDCLVATNDVLEGKCKIKNGTRLIAKYAFSNGVDLTSVTFPESVTYIDEGTFSGCMDLTSVKLTGKIKTVGESAFFGCKSLNKLEIKEGTAKIGQYAFNCCDGIKTIKLPLSLKKIEFAAFYPCDGLKNVYYPGTKAQLDKIKVKKSNGPLFRAALHCKDDVKSLKLKGKKKAFKASWKKVKGAKKYEVMYSLKKDMTNAKTVKSKKNTVTVKNLKSGKKYYVQVRAVRGKEKSQWTKAKAVKTK